MNIAKVLLSAILITTLNSCEDDVEGCMDKDSTNYNSEANVDNGSCKYEGKATFWYDTNGSDATVTINGLSAFVTEFYTTNPNCNSTGCAVFTLPIGAYSYHAVSSFSTWDGSVVITKNGCALVLLN